MKKFNSGLMLIKDYETFSRSIYEQSDQSEISNEETVRRVRDAHIWLCINKGPWGSLLSQVNLYGAELDPPTMCTDGSSIIYDPRFVNSQNDAAIRFVLAHEILHCTGHHHERRLERDPLIWNYACDYAINYILSMDPESKPESKEEDKKSAYLQFPKHPDGTRMGLYDERFGGMIAEDIYDEIIADPELQKQLQKDGKKNDMGHVFDWDAPMPEPEDGLEVKIVDTEDELDDPNDGLNDEDGDEDGDEEDGDEEDGDEEDVDDEEPLEPVMYPANVGDIILANSGEYGRITSIDGEDFNIEIISKEEAEAEVNGNKESTI